MTNTRAIFGFDPTIFPVAAKLALESKLGALAPREWTRSRFEALEDYIFHVLSEKERVRIKLSAPLETILSLSKKQFRMIESRREVLAADKARIESINDQLERARADLVSNFRQFVVRIDNLLMDLERRGLDFLDNYVRIQHVMLLRDSSRFREEFERQVFQGWKGSIDTTIQEAVDWLVKENLKLWNGTVEAFHRRAESDAKNDEIIGRVGREFAYNREEVYARMRQNAEQRLSSYDVNVESRRIIDNAMRAVLHSFGLGAGALGLGYLLTTAVSSTAVDVTGLTAATMLLVTSFLILPYKRSKAKEEFRRRIEEMRGQLKESLDRESTTEIDRMLRRHHQRLRALPTLLRSRIRKNRKIRGKTGTKIEGRAAPVWSAAKFINLVEIRRAVSERSRTVERRRDPPGAPRARLWRSSGAWAPRASSVGPL
jgi:DNA repair exonuclease SbcCD ATPase subunit